MLATLQAANISPSQLILDLGHVGVYRGLTQQLELSEQLATDLFNSVQHGSFPDVQALLSNVAAAQQQGTAEQLRALMNLRGDQSIVSNARKAFAEAPQAVMEALDTLQAVVDGVHRTHPEIGFNIDLAELRGYSYHTGVLFAAYTHAGDELARGGRYDAVGAAFGHPRPATGFSGDMKRLADTMSDTDQREDAIFVSADLVDQAWQEIIRLRRQGERVVTGLDGLDGQLESSACNRVLVRQGDTWTVENKDCRK